MHFDNFLPEDKIENRFLLIGGFLGAGKTTLIGLITKDLEKSGIKTALITNDQGQGLMDTASARQASKGLENVAEITGGCFCCRLEELVNTIKDLEATTRPKIMIAEPVGSCTDLMATVLQPLEKIYQTPMSLSPLSIVLDARRALAALGGKKNKGSFHRDVGYVYRKQLEEAEWLIINKIDLLENDDLEDLRARLDRNYPKKRQFYVSAKTGEGLADWIKALLSQESGATESMSIDYDRYADGEALLGWVNLEGEVSMNCDPGEWLLKLAREIGDTLDQSQHEVGHFKMSLEGQGTRWRVHQVMSGDDIELIEEPSPQSHSSTFRFLVNLRAEGDARTLQGFVHQALADQGEAKVALSQEAAFQPGKPEPTHRIG